MQFVLCFIAKSPHFKAHSRDGHILSGQHSGKSMVTSPWLIRLGRFPQSTASEQKYQRVYFPDLDTNHVNASIFCILITTFLNASMNSPYMFSMCSPCSLHIFPIFSLSALVLNWSTPSSFGCHSGPDTAEEDFVTSGTWHFEQQR